MGGEAREGDGEAWCGGFWGNGAAMSAHDGGGARGNGNGFLFPPVAHRGREKRGEMEGWRAVDVVVTFRRSRPDWWAHGQHMAPRHAHAAVTA
jgi:hypothetical protein